METNNSQSRDLFRPFFALENVSMLIYKLKKKLLAVFNSKLFQVGFCLIIIQNVHHVPDFTTNNHIFETKPSSGA